MTVNLDGFIAEVTQLNPTEQQLRDFVNKGNYKYCNVNKFLAKSKSNLDNALDPRGVLALPAHTTGWAYILGYKALQENIQACGGVETFVHQCVQFLSKADAEQVKELGAPVGDIIRRYATEMRTAGQTETLLQTLQPAMLLCSGSQSHVLSIAHVEFMQSCVDTMRYADALPLAETTMIQVQRGALKYMDNLRYHYYAGLVFSGYKRWKDALSCFVNVLTAPSEGISAVQLAAFKKYVLVSLLSYGKFIELPKFTSNNISRSLPKMCPAYVGLTKAFTKGKQATAEVFTSHAERFTEDKNFGLVQQVIACIPQWKLRELPQVYVNITLAKVAEIVDDVNDAGQARVELQAMIAANQINAMIGQDNVVRFSTEDVPAGGIPRLMAGMDKRIREVQNLSRSTNTVSAGIRMSQSFIKKTMQQSPGAGGGSMSMIDSDAAQAMLLQQQEFMG